MILLAFLLEVVLLGWPSTNVALARESGRMAVTFCHYQQEMCHVLRGNCLGQWEGFAWIGRIIVLVSGMVCPDRQGNYCLDR